MEKNSSQKNSGKLMAVLSLGISLIVFLLIVNWFFKITPYQKLQGIPLLIAPFTSLIGFAMGYISNRKSHSNLAMWSIVSSAILFVLSVLYWPIGTLIFGP